MKQRVALIVGVVAAAGLLGADLLACGEKFLVPGRGLHLSRTPAERGAAGLLVLASPKTALSQALGRLNVEASLRKAGYAPRRLADVADLASVLPSRRWDVLVVDLTEAAVVRDRLRHTNPSLLVLPVAHKPSTVQLAQARRDFPIVLKSLGRSQDALDVLDEALVLLHSRR
jgi:hypothetical protein